MKIVETTFERLPRERLEIGFEGENLRATVRIDCASVFAEYPNATPALIIKPLFADAYPVVVDRNGTNVDWLITSEILSFNGDGEIQLVFYKDQVICKSAVSKIRVSRSLTVTGDMPDPVVQWIDRANAKLAEVDAQIVELEGMVDTATDAATSAEQSASTASTKAEQAAGSAATATEKATEATTAATTATAKAAEAALSATQASNSAVSAADSESGATAKAAEAAQSAQTAAQKAEQITEAAQIATGKAEEASASATSAQTSATNAASSATAAQAAQTAAQASETAASASATQAAQSAQGANTAAQTAIQKAAEATQNATNAAASATSAATSAETASTKAGEAAQSAQAVAETAEQLAESLEQIDQNTADIAEHEQEYNALKEATLIHNTASGSIASFTDGAEMPVDSVTAQINPVQDLHGYDNPWPAGGGKNKFNIDALVNTADITISNGNIIVKGTAKNSRKTLAEISSLTVGETYILTATSTGINNFIYLYGTNESWYFGKERTITQQDLDSTVFFYGIADASVSVTISDMMIRLASETDSAFLPYSNICPITGFEGLTVTRTGKNLLNFADYSYIGNANVIWGGGTSGGADGSLMLNAGTYTFSVSVAQTAIYVVDKNNEYIVPVRYNISSITFTLSEMTAVKLQTYKNNTTQAGIESYDYQLELGSTATAYEPYQGETYPITFPSEAGTVYGGSLTIAEDGSGVLTVDRAEVDLGTLTWNKIDTKSGHWRFWAVLNTMLLGGNMLSSQYKQVGASEQYMGVQGMANQQSGNNTLAMVSDERFADVAAFKTAMNGVQLVYELATPITYTLTASQITTLLGENNLWHDANGDISVGYKANTKLYIDRKIAELVAQIVNS